MLPEDDQPMVHEIGNRTYVVAPVEPLDLDGIRTMQVGTALWAIGFVVLLFGAKRLPDAARSLGQSMRIFKSEVKEMKSDAKPETS